MRIIPLLMDAVFPPRESELLVRAAKDARDTGNAEKMLVPEAVYAGPTHCPVTSLFRYSDETVQACILEAKFQGNTDAAAVLADALHEFLVEFAAELIPFSRFPLVIVPLPLSAARLRERGYNQTARVVRAACVDVSGVEINEELLMRMRNTSPQTSCTGNERKTNVAGAFSVNNACDPLRTYILVDDVVTTGHTMASAVEAMRAGGATHLLPLTLAY